MNLYDNARVLALSVLAAKWNLTVAQDELRDAHIKINTIVMGTSDTFAFDITLPSGRVHKFSVRANNIDHRIINP